MEWVLDAMAALGFFVALSIGCVIVSVLIPEGFLEHLASAATTIFLIACVAVFVYRCAS